MQVIGVTGITGAGKSTVSKKICEYTNGVYIDADEIARNSCRFGEENYKEIVKEFGESILKDNQEIDRKKLAKIVFSDTNKKRKLDNITFRYVVPKIIDEINKNIKNRTVVIDVPLLFESNLDKNCDIVIGVIANKELCLERIMKRDGISLFDAEARLNSQNTENFFKIKCNYCIFNNNEESTDRQIEEILNGQNLSNENTIHIYDEEIEYLQFRKLLEYNNKLRHCYSLKPFNFGKNKDYKYKEKEIKEGYKKICKSLDLNENKIYRPLQMHTDIVKKIDEENAGIFTDDFKNVDGLITNKKDKILSLSYADCISLLFYDPIKNVIGNIHSGWKGTYKEIARIAIRKLKEEYGCNPENLICCIGPSIGKCCFEVNEDVKEMFFNKFKNMEKINEIIIPSNKQNKYLIDTVLINKLMLKQEGLINKNIIESDICTKCKCDKVHSYRAEGEEFEINTAIISLI